MHRLAVGPSIVSKAFGLVLIIALVPFSGCKSSFGGNADRTNDPSNNPPNNSDTPSDPATLRRITNQEYKDSVKSLFALSDEQLSGVASHLLADDSALPASAGSQGMTPERIDAYRQTANFIAQTVMSTPSLAQGTVPCDLNANRQDCLTTVAKALGSSLYRRSITDEEVGRAVAVATTTPDGPTAAKMMVSKLLQSPYFLFVRSTP